MPIDVSYIPNKRYQCTPDPLTYNISVSSVNSVNTLTTPSYPSQIILLTYDDPITDHTVMRDKHGRAMEKIVYFYRHHERIVC